MIFKTLLLTSKLHDVVSAELQYDLQKTESIPQK